MAPDLFYDTLATHWSTDTADTQDISFIHIKLILKGESWKSRQLSPNKTHLDN